MICMRIVLLTDDSLIKKKKGMKWQDVLSFTDDNKVPGLSETFEMILRITLKRSIKYIPFPIHYSSSLRFYIWMTSWVQVCPLCLDAFQRELFISQILIGLSQIMEISHMNC